MRRSRRCERSRDDGLVELSVGLSQGYRRGVLLKVAVTVVPPVMSAVQEALPEQPPPQLTKEKPEPGMAVSATVVPPGGKVKLVMRRNAATPK